MKKTAYRLADQFTAVIGSPEAHSLPVTLMGRPGSSDETLRRNVEAFYRELLDQELREHVAEETGPVRSLILAHAFSKTDLIRRE